MAMSQLVSIIIPCFNQGRFLADAMLSVRAQTYGRIELIVVNDGSDDNTDQVMAKSGGDAIYIKQANAGVSAARNKGAAASSGDYLLFLDADDLLHTQAVEWLMEEMGGRENRLCVMGVRQFSVDPGIGEDRLQPRNTPALPRMFYDNLAPPLAFLCSRKMFEQVGGFDTDLAVWSCEDWDLWLRMALAGCELGTVWKIGGFYRRYSGSVSTNAQRTEGATIRVLTRASEKIRSSPALQNQWGGHLKKMRRRIGQAHFDVGYYYARQGAPIRALTSYSRSIFCGYRPSANFIAIGKAFVHAARFRLGLPTPAVGES
jgi:glycosyltransferase involved in cell wall biosynthesis